MNIENAIRVLKNIENDFDDLCQDCPFSEDKICIDCREDALTALLIAYKRQKEVIEKALEYIKNKGGYCEEYKMTTRPLNTIELDDLLQILENEEVE